jgi:hypothetical protein
MDSKDTQNLEGVADDLHQSILADGRPRFPEESYRQLLQAGASSEEALSLLGYDANRQPLVERDETL